MGIDLGLGKLFDPGALAHAAADAILPKDMQWMSGVLGAAIDFQCGNPMGAIKEGLDTLSDLKDTSLASQKQPGSLNPPGGWAYEPPPPPPRSQAQLLATPPASPSVMVTTSITTTTTPGGGQVIAKAEASATAYFQNAAPASSTSATVPSAPPPALSAPPPTAWRGTPPSLATASNLAQMAMSPSRLLPAVQDPKTMTKDQFFAQGDEALMKAVRDGNIPKEVSDSPAAMQALQARMNQISEMNQLMTSMIQAMHQMEMAVIQNVRV